MPPHGRPPTPVRRWPTRGPQAFHEKAAGGIDVLGFVASWYGKSDLVEGIRVLAAAEEQSRVSADSRFGSSQNAARNGTPTETSQSKCSAEPSQ